VKYNLGDKVLVTRGADIVLGTVVGFRGTEGFYFVALEVEPAGWMRGAVFREDELATLDGHAPGSNLAGRLRDMAEAGNAAKGLSPDGNRRLEGAQPPEVVVVGSLDARPGNVIGQRKGAKR